MTEFVPEMHDLGKLCDKAGLETVPTTNGDKVIPHKHGVPSFSNIDWTRWGVQEPTTGTWAAICHHGDSAYHKLPEQGTVQELERHRSVFLTILADHLAATAGRVLDEEIKRVRAEKEAVYRLVFGGPSATDQT